jgi:hypothetical protein
VRELLKSGAEAMNLRGNMTHEVLPEMAIPYAVCDALV